jgi:hypothetical protein
VKKAKKNKKKNFASLCFDLKQKLLNGSAVKNLKRKKSEKMRKMRKIAKKSEKSENQRKKRKNRLEFRFASSENYSSEAKRKI